jgi:amidohydrolase
MMINVDQELASNLVRWRHQLHRCPETGFNEKRTADYIAGVLEALGMEVHRGIGGTGLVASMTQGSGKGVIGLRADMDALAMTETAEDRPHISQHPGCMHSCGHDGHMAMVLGAAHLLKATPEFDGTVRFIFQPAEEHGRGATAMLNDGLLARFPIDEIYGAHNIPGMPVGLIATRVGGIMASEDNFVIRVQGRGGHAARPHMATDPLVVAAETILALQTIVSRSVDPADSAVVSCTELHTDGIRNAIPSCVTIKGDTRSYSPQVQALLERRIREICAGIASAHGAQCAVEYTHEFVATVNWPQCVPVAVRAAAIVVGQENVDGNIAPMMISEDFGAFLKVVPGAFVFIGNGAVNTPGGTALHNSRYDFNDALLPIGARFFSEVVRQRLPRLQAS